MAINLGEISFGLGPDTSRLRKAATDITTFGRAVNASAQQVSAGARKVEADLRRQEKAAVDAYNKVYAFQTLVARTNLSQKQNADLLNRSTTALNQFVGGMTSGRLSALAYQRQMERFSLATTQSNLALKGFIQQQRVARREELTEVLRRMSNAAVLVAGPLSGIGARFSVLATLAEHLNFKMAALVAGVGAGIFAFVKLGTLALDTARKMDSVRMALDATIRSMAVTEAQLDELQKMANLAGVKFDDLAKQYARVSAASKGSNMEGERTWKIFEAVTFASAKLGATTEETEGVLRAVEQIMSKGVVQAEELRGQLGDRLPGAIRIMAEALGVGTGELNKMMKQGQITSDSLIKFADTLKTRLGIDTTKAVDTIVAAENRWYNATLAVGKALNDAIHYSVVYKGVLNSLSGALEWAAQNMDKVFIILGGITGAFIGLAAPAILNGIISLVAWIGRLTISLTGMSTVVAVAMHPWLALGSLLLRLSLIFGGVILGARLLGEAISSSSDNRAAWIENYIEAQKRMKSSIRNTTVEAIKQLRVLQVQRGFELNSASMELNQAARDVINGPEVQYGKIGQVWNQFMGGVNRGNYVAAKSRVDELVKSISKGDEQLRELDRLLGQQTDEETAIGKRPSGASPVDDKGADRRAKAIREALQSISRVNQEYDRIFQSPAQKEWAAIQDNITNSVQDFKDKLVDAKVPLATQIALTDKFAEATHRAKEAAYLDEKQVTVFEALADVFESALPTLMDSFVDSVLQGKDVLMELGDTARQVTASILKNLMQLAVVNPLMNSLFGQANPTFGSTGWSGGIIGGLLSMFGLGGTATGAPMNILPVTTMHSGGSGRSSGPLSFASASMLRRAPSFHTGLKPDEFYAKLQDGEQVIPRGRRGGGNGTQIVNVRNYTNQPVTVNKTQNGDTQLVDIIFGKVMSKISRGDGDGGFQKRFGLKPAMSRRTI